MLDGLLHPHSSIPYVQMGRSIVLYTVSLLSRDICERVFISQLIFNTYMCAVNGHGNGFDYSSSRFLSVGTDCRRPWT